MWKPITDSSQLKVGVVLRQVLVDGDFQHETTHLVSKVGQHYFMAEITGQNGQEFLKEHRPVTVYRTEGIPYYKFEIWID